MFIVLRFTPLVSSNFIIVYNTIYLTLERTSYVICIYYNLLLWGFRAGRNARWL